MHNLANCYMQGLGTKANNDLALKWYTVAADSGYVRSMSMLAKSYDEGIFSKKDSEKAIEWYKKAAEKEEPYAMYKVARMHEHNDSVASKKGKALRGNTLSNGTYDLVATEPAWITSNQIEAARIAMTRYIKRGGQVWIKIFPDKPITEKPAETRMGSGKGSPEYWVAVVKPGRIMFEMEGVSEEVAREAMRLAGHKLPIKTKFIMKEEG